MARVSFVTDPDDPRLADYGHLKEHRLRDDSGKFVAESELVVRKLLASPLQVCSVLVTAPRLVTLSDVLPADQEVLVASQEIMDRVAGFHVHRGCLAIGRRPEAPVMPTDARIVLVLEDLVDVDNVGAMVRNAAAFGADAVLLSPRCADAYYRKAIRVSMGTVFTMPIVRARDWPEPLVNLRAQLGFALVGAVLDAEAIPLPQYRPNGKVALVLGAEGPGLAAATKSLCDTLVTIPMSRADSLNVATAGAVLLYHLTGA